MTANRCYSRRAGAAALTALVVSLAAASVASADTATITVTAPGGEPDPVAGVRRTFTVAGSTAADQVLYVKHRAADGVACATSPDTDPGQYFTTFTGRRSSGNSATRGRSSGRPPAPSCSACGWSPPATR